MQIVIKDREKKKLVLSPEKTDSDLEFVLGKNSELDLLVVCKAIGQETVKTKVQVIHSKPGAKSKIQMNAVLYDRSEVQMYANMLVSKGISDVSTELKQKALLFSEQAKITLDPVMEIDDNRLTGTHAAVIARPDPNQIYYLMSRGLLRSQAEGLLTQSLLHIPSGYSRIA